MAAIAVGYGPEDGRPVPVLDPKDMPTVCYPGKDLYWDSQRVPIRVTVELPFWVLIPDCELSLSHESAAVSVAVRGNYAEVCAGPVYLDSRANVIHVGPANDLR